MEDQLIAQHRMVERVVASKTGEDGAVKYLTKACRSAHGELRCRPQPAADPRSCVQRSAAIRSIAAIEPMRRLNVPTNKGSSNFCLVQLRLTVRIGDRALLATRLIVLHRSPVSCPRAVAGPAVRRSDIREGGRHREGGRRSAHHRVPGLRLIQQIPVLIRPDNLCAVSASQPSRRRIAIVVEP